MGILLLISCKETKTPTAHLSDFEKQKQDILQKPDTLTGNHSKNSIRSSNHVKSTDSWKGTYHFEASNRDQIKTRFDITIKSLDDISIQINDDGDQESYSHIKAEILNDDKIKLVFDPSLEDEMGIIYIEKSDDTYLISGYPIYFINPGNDEMPLIKEK